MEGKNPGKIKPVFEGEIGGDSAVRIVCGEGLLMLKFCVKPYYELEAVLWLFDSYPTAYVKVEVAWAAVNEKIEEGWSGNIKETDMRKVISPNSSGFWKSADEDISFRVLVVDKDTVVVRPFTSEDASINIGNESACKGVQFTLGEEGLKKGISETVISIKRAKPLSLEEGKSRKKRWIKVWMEVIEGTSSENEKS